MNMSECAWLAVVTSTVDEQKYKVRFRFPAFSSEERAIASLQDTLDRLTEPAIVVHATTNTYSHKDLSYYTTK